MYSKEIINLLDGINTRDFGFVRFLTLRDLIKIGEEQYNKIIAVFSQNIESYGDFGDSYNMFDLITLKDSNNKRLAFNDGEELVELIIYSLSLIYNCELDDIIFNEFTREFSIKNTNFKLNRLNYDSFCEIILKSNMTDRVKKDNPIKFKDGTSEARKQQFEEWIKYEEEKTRKEANSILVIANLVMAKLGLYSNKELLLSMTIHNLLFAYSSEMLKENYSNTYKQYLAGADAKKLDLTHWSEKIKNMIKNKEE